MIIPVLAVVTDLRSCTGSLIFSLSYLEQRSCCQVIDMLIPFLSLFPFLFLFPPPLSSWATSLAMFRAPVELKTLNIPPQSRAYRTTITPPLPSSTSRYYCTRVLYEHFSSLPFNIGIYFHPFIHPPIPQIRIPLPSLPSKRLGPRYATMRVVTQP